MQISKNHSISALYTDIGRGHPNYLDSTLRVLRPMCAERNTNIEITSVFKISRAISACAWKTIEWIYRTGPQNELLSAVYNKIRNRKSEPGRQGLLLRILARDIRHYYADFKGIILVAHPLLVQMLSGDHRVAYIHGEIAAPREFDLSGAEKIYVPLSETSEKMITAGIAPSKIETTGLMLEPELEAQRGLIITARRMRIGKIDKPVIGCFNSGAYPREHVDQMVKIIKYILSNRTGRITLSAGNDPAKYEYFQKVLAEFKPVYDKNDFIENKTGLLILHDSDREKLTLKEIEILEHIDFLVMAAHERVNWSLGLQIPSLLLKPHYGSFATENYQFALKHSLVYENAEVTNAIDSFITDFRNKGKQLTLEYIAFPTNGSIQTAQSILQNK